MSAQAEKATRRDLRRAMGAEAIGVIDHNAQILAALQQRTLNHERWLVKNQEELAHFHSTYRAFVAGQTVWQRLRWLVTGR